MSGIRLQMARLQVGPMATYVVAALLLAGCGTPELPPLAQSAITGSPAPSAPPSSPAATPSTPLTVSEAVHRAGTVSLQVRALEAAVAVARQRRSAATDFEEPEFRTAWGNIGDEFSNPANNLSEWRIGARVFVPNPFLISPRLSARAAELFAAKADLQAARWLLECDVRKLFAELNYLREDLVLAEQLLRQEDEILKDTRARAEHDAATAAEVVAAAQKQLQTLNDLNQTRHQYQVAQRDLAALLDLPPASLQVITNALSYPALPESSLPLDYLDHLAAHARGDITALRWRTVAAKSAYREAENVRIPWVKELTAWNRQRTEQWWLEAAVSVPIFSWTKNHAQDVLLAQYHLASTNELNGLQLVRRELRSAVDELEERRQQQAHHQAESAPLLAEMRQTVELLRRTPSLMPLQVAVTEAQLLESSRLELASFWRYQLALLNLERVLGEPLADALDAVSGKM